MNKKRWIFRDPLRAPQLSDRDRLANELNISLPLAELLVQRGIDSFDKARHFFRPKMEDLHDPFLMKDMDKAVNRLQQCITQNERILVYGDYDVDGSTAVAVFYDFFRKIHSNIDYYIPDRYTEGYGVSWQAIDYAEKNQVDLIVTLDCGIKSIDKVEEAKRRGIDVIVCDHHLPGEDLPPAVAILDPKRSDCAYPFKELTGCGIGFKLISAYSLKVGIPLDVAHAYLDLVMISTAADIVAIVGENRILAFYGLEQLNNQEPRPGIKALLQVAGLKWGELNINNIVFGLAPRINAAGRIQHAREAVNLLITKDPEMAAQIADQINKYNSDRRNFDASITEQALEMITSDPELREARSTVLYHESWHKGVIGIVASRCIEHFHRPTIIFTHSNGKATGSGRSVPGFDLYEAIEECADLLVQFGGHTFAAGMTLEIEKINDFRLRFEEVVRKRITPEQLIPCIEIDLQLNLSDITPKFYNILRQMAPFGPGNMTPNFVSYDLQLTRPPYVMKEKHLRLEVSQNGATPLTAVAFDAAEHLENFNSRKSFALCYTIEENVFRNQRSLQLMVKDIHW